VVAHPALEIGERRVVLPRHRVERLEPGEVVEVHRLRLPEGGEEFRGALVVRDVVRLRQGFEGELTLLAGELRQECFKIAIDDAKLAPRTHPMPVIEHRIPARQVEQLRAELVEKPLVMLGFVFCVRHAVLQAIPAEILFSQSSAAFKAARSGMARPSPFRFVGRRRRGGAPLREKARAARRQ